MFVVNAPPPSIVNENDMHPWTAQSDWGPNICNTMAFESNSIAGLQQAVGVQMAVGGPAVNSDFSSE